jgi:hypothetical protein
MASALAPALDAEHTSIRLYVLLIANQSSSWVSREGRLACTREPEEEGDVFARMVLK